MHSVTLESTSSDTGLCRTGRIWKLSASSQSVPLTGHGGISPCSRLCLKLVVTWESFGNIISILLYFFKSINYLVIGQLRFLSFSWPWFLCISVQVFYWQPSSHSRFLWAASDFLPSTLCWHSEEHTRQCFLQYGSFCWLLSSHISGPGWDWHFPSKLFRSFWYQR